MILSKTPLRVSFVGGGTDYFNSNSNLPGRVIVTTIDKFIYILVNQKHDENIRVSYSETENVNKINNLKHKLIRETLKFYNLKKAIEIATVADIPSSGSGLGSSSALTVGLVNCFKKYLGQKISKKILAKEACKIEIEKCRKLIGMQDQYSTAYGGFNRIEFMNNKVSVKKLNISNENKKIFNNHLLLFYTGINRQADKILNKINKSKNRFKDYEKMSNLALNFEKEIINKNYIECGKILHENWLLKKNLNKNVSSINLDQIYEASINAGAEGGKILGAGGGGYFLFLVKPKKQKNVISNLKRLKLINFNFYKNGSKIINY